MTWTDIVGAHPYLIALVLVFAVYVTGRTTFLCWNRAMRALNVRKHGWPPAHCDADGDLTALYKEQSKRFGLGNGHQ